MYSLVCSSEKPPGTKTANPITTGSSWNHIGQHGGHVTGPWLILIDVVLPTRKGVVIRLRCVTAPDPELAIVLQKLKLKPPKMLNFNPNL